ncbi:glycosyltransferase family A protein [Alkalihalobacillus sp. TS-13]|uniref:glycosyltransferase family A protein n=1 Tax=Alkalihalobacillus sp. TS-13 TaxID=2842455 RepID=UPI001C88C725|nr:glycosyltransferase family 2 protein [Alkalihalobacillus sp. TS-13]
MPINTTERKDRDIEISIIIPTYNKFPQNLLTLYSIENQHFDLSKIEVIMIDDCSTDKTKTLVNRNFPFRFILLRNMKNRGRPASRNRGIKSASGKVLLFLDAEILVPPDFLKIHYDYHQQHPQLVLTGIMCIRKLYSVLYPDFSQDQLMECKQVAGKLSEFKMKFTRFEKNPAVICLIDKMHISSGMYTSLSVQSPYERFYRRTIIANYGYDLKGYRLPWQLFGTGHVSVSRKAIDQVGMFAEYPGYGWDDLEMGYRLYRNGAVYLSDKNLISYHQEHPVSNTIQDESKRNYYKFQETYREIDQMIISLTFLPKPFNLHEVNQILINYQNLCKQYPDRFHLVKRTFQNMLVQIGLLVRDNRPVSNLIQPTLGKKEYSALVNEKNELKKLEKYRTFMRCFNRLWHLKKT